MFEHRLDQGGAITDSGHHLVTVFGEQADEALAQQYRIVSHDDPPPAAGRADRRWPGRCLVRGQQHGSSAVIVVGPPSGLAAQQAADRVQPVVQAQQSVSLVQCRPAHSSSVTQARNVPSVWRSSIAQR